MVLNLLLLYKQLNLHLYILVNCQIHISIHLLLLLLYDLFLHHLQINELFTTYTGEAAKLISQFKGVMNSEGVFIKPNISRSESTKKVVNGKEIEIPDPDYYSGRWWCISNYDVTSNVNSTESANSFTYEFFNIINEKYESNIN